MTATATTMPMMSPMLLDEAGAVAGAGVGVGAGVGIGAGAGGAGAVAVTETTFDGSEWPRPVTARTL